MRNVFNPLRWILQSLLISLSFFSLYRAIFWFYFVDPQVHFDPLLILNSLYIGLKLDMRLVSIFLLLGLLLKFLPAWRLVVTPIRIFLSFFLSLFYFIDFATMSYLQQRISANLFKLATEGSASLEMVWHTYPILRGLLALIFIAILFEILCKKCITPFPKEGEKLRWKSLPLPILLLAALIYGQFAFYPLRWSDAYFSTNHFITQFTLNPVLHFAQTYSFRKLDFDLEKTKKYYPLVAKYLGIPPEEQKDFHYTRHIYPKDFPAGAEFSLPPNTNIVIFIMESMASFKTNLGGNPLNPTPHLAQLSKESVFFDQFYVPVQATARSVFSLMTGIPDVASNKTSSRNPLTVEHNCLLNYFSQHKKYYFLGGSANWGNIEGLFGSNIDDITIRDSGFDAPRVDVWGISDYHLFLQAHKQFEQLHQEKKPFVAIVQSSGYHRPYTIPKNIPGFDLSAGIPEENLKKHGHPSLEEYNSLRFQDFALGNYFQEAKKSPYYENTLYVVFGDHGLPHDNASHSSRIHKDLLLDNWHVPLLFHAKNHLRPQVRHDLASELDIFPTLLGMLNLEYINTTLGFDLFREGKDFRGKKELFTFSWWARPAQFGLMDENVYYYGQYEQSGDIFIHTSQDLQAPPQGLKNDPLYKDRFQEMEDLATGIYETARYMLYHNKKKQDNPRQ